MILIHKVKDYLLNYETLRLHTSFHLIGALNNRLLVLPDVISVYRNNVSGSTTELIVGDIDEQLKTAIKRI